MRELLDTRELEKDSTRKLSYHVEENGQAKRSRSEGSVVVIDGRTVGSGSVVATERSGSTVTITDVKSANCLSMDVFTESSKKFPRLPSSKSSKMLADVSSKSAELHGQSSPSELSSECEGARALEPVQTESSRTLQTQAQEDSGTDVEGLPGETDLMSWSERTRSKPTRESVSQVKQLQQRHLYTGRGASHLGCQRFCWANPFTVKQHGLHRAIEKFEEMLNNTPTLLQKLGQLTNRVLLSYVLVRSS